MATIITEAHRPNFLDWLRGLTFRKCATAVNDQPKVTAQDAKDVGMQPDDLLARPVYDASLPFFMQHNFW